MKNIVLFTLCLCYGIGTFGKDNFKMSGRIDGVIMGSVLLIIFQIK